MIRYKWNVCGQKCLKRVLKFLFKSLSINFCKINIFPYLCSPNPGELSEWLKEPASKTGVLQGTGGSNPSLTASKPASAGFSR